MSVRRLKIPRLTRLFLIIFWCSYHSLNVTIPSRAEPDVYQRELRAARSYDARLPCGPGKIFLDGPEAYVLWLKDDETFLYRYPSEGTEVKDVALNSLYGTKCLDSDDHCYDDTSLFLPRVTERDSGLYRCRVHYQGSSAVDYIINLSVVGPIGIPQIYNRGLDVSGTDLRLISGSNVTLDCVVPVPEGANPASMMWTRDHKIMDKERLYEPGTMRLQVKLTSASKKDHNVVYKCSASNTATNEPLTAEVRIVMMLPPERVEIRLNENEVFEAGVPRVVDCVVTGSAPPATVEWFLNHKKIQSKFYKEHTRGDTTVSSLTFTPGRDRVQNIRCKALNPVGFHAVESSAAITVGFRPRCNQEVSTIYVPRDPKVFALACNVISYPEPFQYVWNLPENRTKYSSDISEMGRDSFRSTIGWVPHINDTGHLECRAINNLGKQVEPCIIKLNRTEETRFSDCLLAEPDAATINCENKMTQTTKEVTTDPTQLTQIELSSSKMYVITASVAAVVGLVLVGLCAMVYCKVGVRRQPVEDPHQLAGSFHREPDFTREERIPESTINVHQYPACENNFYLKCTSPPIPKVHGRPLQNLYYI